MRSNHKQRPTSTPWRKSRCLVHLKWVMVQRRLNVKIHIASWRNSQKIVTSLQYMMVMVHQERKPVKPLMIIFRHTWKKIKRKLRISPPIRLEKVFWEQHSRVQKVNWSHLVSITPILVLALLPFSSKRISAISLILVIVELFYSGRLTKKSLLLNYLTIISLLVQMRRREVNI